MCLLDRLTTEEKRGHTAADRERRCKKQEARSQTQKYRGEDRI
jgi:hypothetical protein